MLQLSAISNKKMYRVELMKKDSTKENLILIMLFSTMVSE